MAGSVVLGHSAAGAEEGPTSTSGTTETSTTGATDTGAANTSSPPAPAEATTALEKPVTLEAGPAKAPVPGTKAPAKPRAVAAPRKAAATVRKAPAKRAAATKAAGKPGAAKPVAATARLTPARTVTVKVAPAEAAPAPLAGSTTVPTQPVELVAPQGGTTPLDGSGGPADGTINGQAAVPTSSSSLTAGEREIDSGQVVAGGSPPPDDTGDTATAPANQALVTQARSHPAVLTGTSPSGDLTITIDQPAPGTVVPPGSPVLVTGTVGGTPAPINFIYVIDISRSTGLESDCGLQTGTEASTILDCEVAGLINLNEANGEENADVDVSVIAFDSTGMPQDVSPAPGIQLTTGPRTGATEDTDPDVVRVLLSLSSSEAPANYDAALLAIQAVIVDGEINIVFLVSDGLDEFDTAPSTGPGTPLQFLIDAGVTIFTFGFDATGDACNAGEPLQVVAIGGGECDVVTDAADMRVTLFIEPAFPVDRVEIEVNGFVGIADLDGDRFSILIPAGLLNPGRNDIVARAFGAFNLEGEVAEANTFVVVRAPLVGEPDFGPGDLDLDLDLDLDRISVRVAGLDEVTPRAAQAGSLPVTGSNPGRLATTGLLSFLLGSLFVGRGRHRRERRRSGAPA